MVKINLFRNIPWRFASDHFGSENRLRAETAQIDILNDEKLKQKYTQPAGGGAARRPASGPVFNRGVVGRPTAARRAARGVGGSEFGTPLAAVMAAVLLLRKV